MGMFLQSVMLTAREHGLGRCSGIYRGLFRSGKRILKIPDQYSLICGLSLGYPDDNHPVNQYRTSREEVETFASWLE